MGETRKMRAGLLILAAALAVHCATGAALHESEWEEAALPAGSGPEQNNNNVYGEPLQLCSSSGMAMTGFTRNGKCQDQNDDTGSHHICIDLQSTVTKDGQPFNFCKATGQPNWCSQEGSCFNAAGECPRKNWCVCQWAFTGYLAKAGGCDMIQKIQCESVNQAALYAYNKEVTKNVNFMIDGGKVRDSLACLKKRCCEGDKKCVPTPVDPKKTEKLAME